MVGAAIAVFYYALQAGGGLETHGAIHHRVRLFGPGHLDPLGAIPVFTAMGFFLVFAVGNLGQPHMLHKFFMLDDPRKLKWMPMIVGVTQTLCVLIWLGIGLAVPSLVAGGKLAPLVNPDDASPQFLLNFTPEILAGIVFAGILAAIMSTADSFVNIGSAAIVRDLPKAIGRKVNDELFWGRIAVVGIAVSAAVFAYFYGDLIALLGTFAFGTFGAALGPALAIGLNWRRVTAAAAVGLHRHRVGRQPRARVPRQTDLLRGAAEASVPDRRAAHRGVPRRLVHRALCGDVVHRPQRRAGDR